jgi:glycosyltransferase involved in cell wall biosynthesis
MKKKILFIISNFESGGVSKSMSSLLNVVDTHLYEVDCLVLSPKGVFLSSIPKDITVISDERTALLFSEFPSNLVFLLKNGWLLDSLFRFIAAFLMLFNKGMGAWLLSRRIHRIAKHYDLAVDYNGQHQLYYLVDFIKAAKKVTFFHSDYSQWNYYYKMDKKYFPKVDQIFTISENCVRTLQNYFPLQSEKIQLFENISSPNLITKMAQESISEDFRGLTFVTIGHVCENKGTSLALATAQSMKDTGLVFKWYFIGKVTNDLDYPKLVKELNLEDFIFFIGIQSNPYPYMQQATLIIHPSKFEGKSIALDEAKILCKPIVVTNFSTVEDQFEDGVTATICNSSADDLTHSIMQLVENKSLQQRYTNNLFAQKKDNTSEIQKLYHLIN